MRTRLIGAALSLAGSLLLLGPTSLPQKDWPGKIDQVAKLFVNTDSFCF